MPVEGAQILELPEYDLAVIALPDAGGSSAPAERRFDAVRSAVAAASEIASGPEVYETTEPGPEALIAIAEVIAKFKEDVSEDARKRLLAKHKLSVKQADYPEPGTDLLELPSDGDPVAVANELHESDLVEFAEPNFVHLTPRPEERGLENGMTMTAPRRRRFRPSCCRSTTNGSRRRGLVARRAVGAADRSRLRLAVGAEEDQGA